MSVISIIGTSASGKSFLVKQLASITQTPVFFEGEEGTIPEKVLHNIFNGVNPVKRWEFFLKRYKKNLERAFLISKKLQLDCFVDGSFLSAWAILNYEQDKYKNILIRLIKKIRNQETRFDCFTGCQ